MLKYTFLSCSAYASSLHPEVSCSWKLLFTPLPPARTLYSVWHSAWNPSTRRFGHCKCIIIIAFHIFLSRRWTSCLVYLGIPPALCTCGHSKTSIKVSCISKWKRKCYCLCMQTNSDLSMTVFFLMLFSTLLSLAIFCLFIRVIFRACDTSF